MASLKVPEAVPSPAEDSQRLRKAFQGLRHILVMKKDET